MNILFIVLSFCEFVRFTEGSLITLEGNRITRDDGTEVLFFNCTVLRNPISPYAEFLINHYSVASSMYDDQSKECIFYNTELNCNGLCKCSSDGRVFTWIYPIPTETIEACYSCQIFVERDFAEEAHVCYDELDLIKDEKDDEHINSSGTKFEQKQQKQFASNTRENIVGTTIRKIITTIKPTLYSKFQRVDSYTVESTIKDMKLRFTPSLRIGVKETYSNTDLPVIYSTEKPLLWITSIKDVSSNDTISAFQHWFYYGPLIGVGLFCLFLVGCNIAVTHKCRTKTVVIEHTFSGLPQQTQITTFRSMQTSQGDHNNQMLDYESINECDMIGIDGNNEDEGNDRSQTPMHSYIDVIGFASEPTPYECVQLVSKTCKNEYCILEVTNDCHKCNDNKVDQTADGSCVYIECSKSDSSSDYMDIISRNSRSSEHTLGTHVVLSLSNLSSD